MDRQVLTVDGVSFGFYRFLQLSLGFNQKDDVVEESMLNDKEEEYECICRLKIVQSECSLESLEFNIDLQPLGMIVKNQQPVQEIFTKA